MIQIGDLEELTVKDVEDLEEQIKPILKKRKELKSRIYRNGTPTSVMKGENKPIVAIEKYILETASGYLGGKAPKYEVQEIVNPAKRSLIKRILDKVMGEKNLKDEMEVILQYITNYNDDADEYYRLVKDYLSYGACYEIVYEDDTNEKIYCKLDPLQTVAIYNYSTPINLIGIVRYYEENLANGKTKKVLEVTDKNSLKLYEKTEKEYVLVDEKAKLWGDVPGFAIEEENGISIFEPIIDLVDSYEQVYNNAKNTHQYNDNAKLKVTGYSPSEPLTITDKNGNVISNPARKAEDSALLNSEVFYTPDKDGNIEWIEKNINDGAVINFEKTTMDLISLIGGVPNTTDTGFSNADNSSALEKKFFTLEQMITSLAQSIKKGILRRWELIFNRINFEKSTSYDFRQIEVKLYRNMPTDKQSETNMALQLRGTVSDETVISLLPYELNAQAEIEKLKSEQEENNNSIDILSNKEVIEDEDRAMETDRQTTQVDIKETETEK